MNERNRMTSPTVVIALVGDTHNSWSAKLASSGNFDLLEACLDAVLFPSYVPDELYVIERALDCVEVLAGLTGRLIHPPDSLAAEICEAVKAQQGEVTVEPRLWRKAQRALERIHRSRGVEKLWADWDSAQAWKLSISALIGLTRTH